MQTLCPFCAKSISESAEVCPNCKKSFKEGSPKGSFIRRPPPEAPPGKAPPRKERELPPHMRSPMEEAESVLPPHMLEGVREAERREARPPEPKGSPVLMVGIGLAILAAVLILPWIKPPPAPVVVVVPPEPAQPPSPPPQAAAEPPAEKKEEPPPPRRPAPKPRPVRRKPAPAPAARAAPVPSASVPRPTKWRLRGRLRNLVTLEPVADADLVFLDASSGQKFMSATGPNGDFRISLPPSYAGYNLQIRHPDYDSKYLVESEEAYASMAEEERQTIADRMGQHSHPDMELLKAEDDGSLRADIVVVPRPKHGMTLEEALAR